MSYIYSKSEYVFIEFDLQDLRGDWKNPYAITLSRYNEKDLEILDETLKQIEKQERPFDISEVKHRLTIGHILFIAKKDDKIIGFFWLGTNYIEVPYFHATIHLTAEELIDYNSFILKEYRGRRINSVLKAYAFQNLKKNGYKRVYGYINDKNRGSLRANEYFGFRTIGKITDIIILTLEFRYHNLSTDKIIFHGGVFRLWKGLYRKIRAKLTRKKLILHFYFSFLGT
jgi:GNAT superfamily N-acetyltransferase